jgi:hypothetical protein
MSFLYLAEYSTILWTSSRIISDEVSATLQQFKPVLIGNNSHR